MISHLGILVYFTYAAGLKGVVIRSGSDTFMNMVPHIKIDPVKGNELGELVLESLTLSRRDTGLEVRTI